ncbi:MAG: carboxypeptidase regulatory-like domain-containing protein [Actinomycetota bacterium]
MPAIRGRVASGESSNMSNTTVELVNATGDIVDQVQTDDAGAFVLHVSSGTWKLNAYDPNGRRGVSTVDVGEDDASIELTLSSSST